MKIQNNQDMHTAPAITGIQFPADHRGVRSTTGAGQSIFADSYRVIDPAFSMALKQERNWRKNYASFMPAMTHTAAKSPKLAQSIAEQGLASCYEQFEFIRNDKAYKLHQAMALFTQPHFRTACIEGQSPFSKQGVTVEHKGRTLCGESLKKQIAHWLEKDIIEESHAQDLFCMLNDAKLQDLSGQNFVLLGASSEIGPLSLLLALGANVIAIGRENPANWQRLINMARRSPGKLYVPCKRDPSDMSDFQIANLAGADLLTQTPEIASWINGFDAPLTLGNYAYLDGANHVRLVMAMDAIVTRLTQKRDDISLAYLLTPSDVYAVPNAVTVNAKVRCSANNVSGLAKKLLNKITQGYLFASCIHSQVQDDQGRDFGILDNLVPQQGPNYVLAKRIQRWRAITSVNKGIRVSCNVAPATATKSVMSNKFFAAATMGSESFGVEVFTPDTANALMTLQLIFDIRSEQALEPSEMLFIHGANHGGSWQLGYCLRSVLVPSLIVGFVQKILPKAKPRKGVNPVPNRQQIA